uniref:Cys2/His2 zinc-finger transcription factor n=1 Tax=Silene latifolia TaxID=37657 RepID=Q4U316_SILLA|nr:Cys2/His2 zinc-finger transcription factor [Silene latifolia]
MEKQRCKLCYRRFSNGRALGGHMRSHMMNMPVTRKPELPVSSWTSESEPEEGEIIKGNSSSVTLQDRGSDTESTKNVTRMRRSKRARKPVSSILLRNSHDYKLSWDSFDNYYNDVEQQTGSSSISEVTSEEDVAFCLMMMSRDKWHGNEHGHRHGYEKEFRNNVEIEPISYKKKYKCDTCNKVFRSYQALGGHRASHKKTRVTAPDDDHREKNRNVVATKEGEKKIHKCPICFRVFASGQALGGHKRSHVIDNPIKSGKIIHQIPKMKMKTKIITENFIDLNLPAPIDDDEEEEIVSQIATSSVSHVHL